MIHDFIEIVRDYMFNNEVKKIDSDYAHEVMREELHAMLDRAIDNELSNI